MELEQLPRARTLLILIHSECQYCAASAPLYRELTSLRESGELSIAPVLVSWQREPPLREFIRSQRLHSLPMVVLAPDSRFAETATPALILLDENRQVLNSWVGQISPWPEVENTFPAALGMP